MYRFRLFYKKFRSSDEGSCAIELCQVILILLFIFSLFTIVPTLIACAHNYIFNINYKNGCPIGYQKDQKDQKNIVICSNDLNQTKIGSICSGDRPDGLGSCWLQGIFDIILIVIICIFIFILYGIVVLCRRIKQTYNEVESELGEIKIDKKY